jgi:hypothetical protein
MRHCRDLSPPCVGHTMNRASVRGLGCRCDGLLLIAVVDATATAADVVLFTSGIVVRMCPFTLIPNQIQVV